MAPMVVGRNGAVEAVETNDVHMVYPLQQVQQPNIDFQLVQPNEEATQPLNKSSDILNVSMVSLKSNDSMEKMETSQNSETSQTNQMEISNESSESLHQPDQQNEQATWATSATLDPSATLQQPYHVIPIIQSSEIPSNLDPLQPLRRVALNAINIIQRCVISMLLNLNESQ